MKVLIFFACALLTVSASEDSWNNFTLKRVQANNTDEKLSRRYAIFEKNLATIEEHNKKYAKGLIGWYETVNRFTDLTEDEFRATLTLKEFIQTGKVPNHKIAKAGIPDSIDWRKHGIVTKVKDQGNCGSCWCFSATGTFEGIYARQTGQRLTFSEQNCVDCATKERGYTGYGCEGGTVQSALDYIKDHGITTEDNYPYRGKQDTCIVPKTVVKGSGYIAIPYMDEEALKNAVGTVGPVSVAINADQLQLYGGGIISSNCSNRINHAVLVVGYGRENDIDYWIIKNSWGQDWGESGYFRMVMGKNMCGITRQACYAKL